MKMEIAYHGSSAYPAFTRFRKSKTGALGPGIYFSKNKNDAERYALRMGSGFVYMVELEFSNPFYVQSYSDPAREILLPGTYKRRVMANSNYCYWIKESDIKRLRQKNYDAIIMKDEIMVFDNNQIKILNVEKVSA